MTALGLADMHGMDGRGVPQLILAGLSAYLVYFAVSCRECPSLPGVHWSRNKQDPFRAEAERGTHGQQTLPELMGANAYPW